MSNSRGVRIFLSTRELIFKKFGMLIVPRLLQDFARDQRVKSRKSDLYFTPHVPYGYIQNLVICRQKSANYLIANFQANFRLTLP